MNISISLLEIYSGILVMSVLLVYTCELLDCLRDLTSIYNKPVTSPIVVNICAKKGLRIVFLKKSIKYLFINLNL